MNEKNLYSVTAILMALMAAGHIFASRQRQMVWGVDADAATVFMSKRWAVLSLACGWVLMEDTHAF